MSQVESYVSTEQKQALSADAARIIEYLSSKGIALIKIDGPLPPEQNEPCDQFLVSYKIRQHDIGMVKIPAAKDPDERWRMLALHLEVESQRLG